VETGASQYFAILDEGDRRGPFHSMMEPVALLKQISRDRGHTQAQARDFFHFQSAVEQVETLNGEEKCFRVGWLDRERTGRLKLPRKMK